MWELLEESVIYQDIFQIGWKKGYTEGLQIGLQQGFQQSWQLYQKLVLRFLEQRCGRIPTRTKRRISQLSIQQLTALGAALSDFKSKEELLAWLKHHQY